MLGFFSNKSDHPLANLKSAQKLLDDLPKTDPVEVIQEMGHWIDELFNPDNEFRLDHQFAVLRLLDDAAHPHLRKITHSYFAAVPPSEFQENRLWGAMNAYYTYSELGYMHVLAGLRNGEKGSATLKPSVALICARGIYGVFGILECAAVRYAQIDPKLWVHLAEFYAHAEAEGCQNELLLVYHGSSGQTTIQHLFASLLMWYMAAVGTFRPLDLHIAKRLISHMSKSFAVSEKCKPGSLFAFDLSNPVSPIRLKDEGAMYPPGLRFVSSGEAAKQLDNTLRTLGKHLVPEELGLGVAYSPDVVSEVAHNLAECCHAPLPTRRSPRRRIKVNMDVANGFLSVMEQADVWLNLNDAASESWEVEDISTIGLRCVLPAGRASNVKIGGLVGLRPEKVEHWGVGIVRRLSRDGKNNLHIGVEMLASKVISVALQGHDGFKADAIHPALLLDKPDVTEGEGWVLMRHDTFSNGYSPKTELAGQDLLLLPLGLVEKGVDFDLARYRKLAHETGGDGDY